GDPGAESGRGRRGIATITDHDRVDEVLVQVVDVLDDPTFPRAGDRDVVEHRQVLDELAQPHSPGVRADGYAELRGQQQDRDVVVDAADPGGVELEYVDRAGLEQLLEDHPVLHVLSGGDADRRHAVADRPVPEDVVWRGGFLDPVRVELAQL